MQPFRRLVSKTIAIESRDIDTDQIIPARFLTTTSTEGLGRHLFADWRYRADGSPIQEFILNRPEAQGAQILVAGENFGCGSSREHAPWALLDYGLRAVISTEIADIFRDNALRNGFLPVTVDPAELQWLLRHPGAEIAIDLDALRLTLPQGREIPFAVEAFARHCLLNGTDEFGYLRGQLEAIARFEAARR